MLTENGVPVRAELVGPGASLSGDSEVCSLDCVKKLNLTVLGLFKDRGMWTVLHSFACLGVHTTLTPLELSEVVLPKGGPCGVSDSVRCSFSIFIEACFFSFLKWSLLATVVVLVWCVLLDFSKVVFRLTFEIHLQTK